MPRPTGGVRPPQSTGTQSPDPALREALLAEPREDPSEFGELLALFGAAAAQAIETAGPAYLGYVPGGGLYVSALAEFLARSANRFTGLAATAPELAAMEHGVLRWLCRTFSAARDGGRPDHHRRVDGHPVRNRGGAPGPARRGLQCGNPLPFRAHPPQRGQGRTHRRAPRGGRAGGAHHRRPADGRGRGESDDRRGPAGRAPAVPARRERGQHRYRDHRPARRPRPPGRARGPMVPRRRRLRRFLPAHPARPRRAVGRGGGRLDRPGSAQGPVPPVRYGCPAGPRHRAAAGRALRRRRAMARRSAATSRISAAITNCPTSARSARN